MSQNTPPTNDTSPLAAQWFAKYRDAAKLSDSEQQQLEQKLIASGQLDELAQCQAAWAQSKELEQSEQIQAIIAANNALISSQKNKRENGISRRGLIGFSVAASLGLAIGFSQLKSNSSIQHWRTDVGQTKNLTLADGSIIQLNTNSQVKVTYSSGKRQVELIQGEAMFTVAKDPLRPFEVNAQGTITRAVGTQFNVWSKPSGVDVDVLEGIVELERNQQLSSPISAGQRITYNVKVFGKLESNLSDRAMAWAATGNIPFHNTPLIEAITEFNRYHKTKMMIEPGLEQTKLSGTFSSADQKGFLFTLDKGFSIAAREQNGKILLYSIKTKQLD